VSEPERGEPDRPLAAAPWTALLLAGSRPGRDLMAEQFGVAVKALIPVAGAPMVARVARVLLAVPEIGRVRVIGPAALDTVLPKDARLLRHEADGSIAQCLRQVLAEQAPPLPLVVTTADHPLLSAETLRDFLQGARTADLSVAGVERADVLRRFGDTRRTWLRFRGGAYTGANLFAVTSRRALPAIEMWARVEQQRKSGLKLVRALGPGFLLAAAFRLLTAEGALRRAGARLGLDARAVILRDPLAAVDVDSAADHALVSAVLEGRG